MKNGYWCWILMAIGLLAIIIAGCHRQTAVKPQSAPVDKDVTAKIIQTGFLNQFRVEVSYAGKRDMEWWAHVAAILYNGNGKEVLPREPGISRFRWVEDTSEDDGRTAVNHFGNFRKDNPLIETLILDASGLKAGIYQVKPIVSLFERGPGADPQTLNFQSQEYGLKPGKLIGCTITIK